MILQMFAVYDSKAQAYNQPFFMHNKGVAIRAITSTVNDPSSELNRYPGDYTLFHLGEWDDSNGQFALLNTPLSLGLAQEFVSK